MKKEEYKKIFEQEERHWWYLGMKEITARLLSTVAWSRKNTKILDVGCGTGGMLIFLKQFGKVWGIDLSKEALNYCRKRGLKNILQASVEKIPFPDKSFDLVTSFDVLYHQWIKNDLFAIREINRVLKPGGYFLVRVPAYNWLRGRHDKVVYTKHRYTRKELTQKLKISGFKILRATYANTFLFPFIAIKRLLERFSPESQDSDVKPTLQIINRFLTLIFYFEAVLISKIDLPIGLSLFVIAQKPSPKRAINPRS